jgi:ABC-type multidrug transport system fused ATPase/permease subunit
MAQLPNIVEKERGLFPMLAWALGLAYRFQKKMFLLFLIFTIISSALSFLNIISFSKIVSILSTHHVTFQEIIPYLILLFAVQYIPPLLDQIKNYFDGVMSRETRESLDQEILKKISTFDIATIEQPEFQDLLAKSRRGANSTNSLIDFSFNIIRDLTSFVIASVILIKVLPIGFFIIIGTLIPTFVFEHFSSKKLFKLWELQIANNRSIGNKSNIFSGRTHLLEVKFNKIADYFLKQIDKLRLGKNVETDRYSRWRLLPFAGVSFLAEIGTIAVIAGVVYQVTQGHTTLGALTLIWGTLTRFSSVTEGLFRSFGRLTEHHAHALKLYSLLVMGNYIDEDSQGVTIDAHPPKIEFRNVSFRYPDTDAYVLKNISFIINPKEEIALVGLNGAGKTTLLRLVTRVYDPTEGEILINDIPLANYNLTSWRNMMSIMNQDYIIFQEETIRNNIIFDKQSDEKLIDKVIVESDVASYVDNYEQGVDQLIGKEFYGGTELSKGQNQKLTLARTLYRNTPLVVLDEPTAAVDAISEDMIFKSLREGHKDQTRIIISHKFSNVRDADKIILIEHGKIIEEGNHEKLMGMENGKYKELFLLQAEGYK